MYQIKNKTENVEMLNSYMFSKTLSMFEWEDLPETIPQKELEKLLQVNGYAFITKVKGDLYAFAGGLGGESDAYGNPTQIIINNPYLKFNKTLDIKKDGVLIYNDDLKLGLKTFFDKQNTLLVENDINMNVSGKNTRINTILSAPDDTTKQSAESYLKKIDDGETAVIAESTAFFDGIKVHNATTGTNGTIKDLLEYNQYIKSNLFNEVGLSSNFNMKRERLLSAEVDQSEDSLFPLVYNMIACRLEAIEKINAMYELNIDVDFGSVWHYKNRKLVDGVIENDHEKRELDSVDSEITNDGIENSNQEQQPDQENNHAGEPEPETIEVAEDETIDSEKNQVVEVETEQEQEQATDEEQERERGQGLDLEPEPEPDHEKEQE